jgi:hypothetical protein
MKQSKLVNMTKRYTAYLVGARDRWWDGVQGRYRTPSNTVIRVPVYVKQKFNLEVPQ